jgi:hypothetical protein
MESTSFQLPTRSQATQAWLLTVSLGTLIIMGYLGVHNDSSNFLAFISVAAIILVFSALFSSPTLLILPLASRWALTAPTFTLRRLRLALVVAILFGTLAVSIFLLTRDVEAGPKSINIFWFAAPYLPAALVAAAYVYRPWLFRP